MGLIVVVLSHRDMCKSHGWPLFALFLFFSGEEWDGEPLDGEDVDGEPMDDLDGEPMDAGGSGAGQLCYLLIRMGCDPCRTDTLYVAISGSGSGGEGGAAQVQVG